ncbi:MAG: hypothetical protein IJA05_07780 [Oscillospiraceae bacterium]|nr:hypothetical protein [Oscillospiraceae bacterium]
MKILGIILLFFSVSSFGFLVSENYVSLLKDVKRVDSFIKNILLGIESENMTINEIFDFTENSCDDKTKNFLSSVIPENFKNISEVAYITNFCKDRTVNSILEEVFFVLGKYSAAEQIREINFCRNKINTYYQKIEAPFLQKIKLLRYSGVLAGMFAAIIFI